MIRWCFQYNFRLKYNFQQLKSCMYEVWILATSSSHLQGKLAIPPKHPPRMKLSLCLVFCLILGVTSLPTLKPSSVVAAKANLSPLSRSSRTLSSLSPAFLFEAVRGLANILQGLSSFLFTGTSVFGLLNLFKPGGSAAGAGQLLGAALPGGGSVGGIQDIGGIAGSLPGILGNLSPKSNKAFWAICLTSIFVFSLSDISSALVAANKGLKWQTLTLMQ